MPSLSEILVKNGALDPADRAVLESLVERHIARHGGDPEKSLSSLELIVPSRSTLESFEDPDILKSSRRWVRRVQELIRAPMPMPDPDTTGSWPGTMTRRAAGFASSVCTLRGGWEQVFLSQDGEVKHKAASGAQADEGEFSHRDRKLQRRELRGGNHRGT